MLSLHFFSPFLLPSGFAITAEAGNLTACLSESRMKLSKLQQRGSHIWVPGVESGRLDFKAQGVQFCLCNQNEEPQKDYAVQKGLYNSLM